MKGFLSKFFNKKNSSVFLSVFSAGEKVEFTIPSKSEVLEQHNVNVERVFNLKENDQIKISSHVFSFVYTILGDFSIGDKKVYAAISEDQEYGWKVEFFTEDGYLIDWTSIECVKHNKKYKIVENIAEDSIDTSILFLQQLKKES